MNVGGYTATGPRDTNEDNFYFLDFSDVDAFVNGVCAFAMVSDGMGGYQGGDVASGLAVACAKSYLTQLVEMAGSNQVDLDVPAALAEIVQNAHESILAEANTRGNLSMGATFVGVFVSETHAWVGHVGDSRCYLVRDGHCRQLTEDHSHVGHMLSRGVITEKEAQNHPERNRIERALGFNDARPDVSEVDLVPGDALLLCSDGVYTVLDAEKLGACVSGARDASEAARRAVKLSIRRGTDDNSTAVVVMDGLGGRGGRTSPGTLVADARSGDTQANASMLANADDPHREGGRHDGTNTETWKRVLPFALAVALAGAMAYLGLRGYSDNARSGQVMPEQAGASSEEADAAKREEAPVAPSDGPEASVEAGDQPPSQGADAVQVNVDEGSVPEDASAPADEASEGYGLYEAPQDRAVTLRYIDHDGAAQSFSYEPLSLSIDPLLLPGATVTVQVSSDSYGHVEGAYQVLSDAYLDDLRRDVSRCAEGSLDFDSALAQLVDPSDYLTFVQALSQTGSEALDETVAHLAVETLSVAEQ
ncbi:MAG: serine/threonine-protein phosphatase [Atopobiaceae bacterium]|nr:serine/threonine-protein phosphatase [Atopobiaceae bacterium]